MVLPLPFGPTRATRSPASIRTCRSRITGSVRSNPKRRLVAVMIGDPSAADSGIDGRAGAAFPPSPIRRSTAAGNQIPASRSRAADRRSTSCGVPKSIGRPSPSSARMRSAMGQAASTRCSIRTIVVDRSARRAARRSMNASAPAGSRLAVGSSSTRTPGVAPARRPGPVAAAGRRTGAAIAVVRARRAPPRRAPPGPASASPTAARPGSRGRRRRRPRPAPSRAGCPGPARPCRSAPRPRPARGCGSHDRRARGDRPRPPGCRAG